MPLEASALLLDVVGLGKPLWVLTGLAIEALLRLAHMVAALPGAVAMMPSMPRWAFALMVAGGLWLCLWTSRMRLLGLVPVAIGAAAGALAPTPDLLATGDGRHLVIVDRDGTPLLLRDRAGDYVRQLFAEASGYDGDPENLGTRPYSDCSRDACLALIRKDGADWRVLATRSATRIDWATITRACADADIVISERWLPRGCTPRWLKLDRAALAKTGGVSIYLGPSPRVETVAERVRAHPWRERVPVRSRSTPRARFPKDR
jgi:competence protein ComEC